MTEPTDLDWDAISARIDRIASRIGGVSKLADATGLSQSQLYRYVGRQSRPSLAALFSIAAAGGADIGWLIQGAPLHRDPGDTALAEPPTEYQRAAAAPAAAELEERCVYAALATQPAAGEPQAYTAVVAVRTHGLARSVLAAHPALDAVPRAALEDLARAARRLWPPETAGEPL